MAQVARRRIRGARRWGLAVLALLVLAAAAAVAIGVDGGGSADAPDRTFPDTAPTSTAGTPAPVIPLAEDNAWTMDVRSAPLADNSRAQRDNLVRQVERAPAGNVGLNTRAWNTTIITAPPGTPRVDVRFVGCGYEEAPHFRSGPAYLNDVPIPADAAAGLGGDSAMSIHDPATDQLWEFWRAKRTGSHWQACAGGRIDGVSHNRGYFPRGYGSAASGLILASGHVTIEEARAGRIGHALAMGLSEVADASRVSWPAQRSDGTSTAADAIREGQRIRLDPSVDVEALPLSRMGKVIARALQVHGALVVDRSGGVTFYGESGQVAIQQGRPDPWESILDAQAGEEPGTVLDGLPWERMQFLPVDWGREPRS
ncbi:hypothetical protein ACQP1U_14490 [Actinomycetota bacterium]